MEARRQCCAASSGPACVRRRPCPVVDNVSGQGLLDKVDGDAYVQFGSGEAREVKKRTCNHLYELRNMVYRGCAACWCKAGRAAPGRAGGVMHSLARVFA